MDFEITEDDLGIIIRMMAQSPAVWNAQEPTRTVWQCGAPVGFPLPPPTRFRRKRPRALFKHVG